MLMFPTYSENGPDFCSLLFSRRVPESHVNLLSCQIKVNLWKRLYVHSKCIWIRLHSCPCWSGVGARGVHNYTADQGLGCKPYTKLSVLVLLRTQLWSTVHSVWFYAYCSSRGGSLCPGTSPLFSLHLMETSTSCTPLLMMQAYTAVPPPVPWAMLAERSSSASTVSKCIFDYSHPKYKGCIVLLFSPIFFSHAKNNGCEWPWQHREDGRRGGNRGCSAMWGPGESNSTSHMEQKWASHPPCHSWVRWVLTHSGDIQRPLFNVI